MTTLLRYEAACLALVEAHSFDEVKEIRDKSEAMRIYGIQLKNVDLEIMASEIRLRAERRLGELIIEEKEAGRLLQGRPKKHSEKECFSQPTLRDLGIEPKLSMRAQRLGGVAEKAFEAMVARKREEIARKAGRVSLDLMRDGDKRERRAARESHLGEMQAAANLKLPDKRYGVILADPEWRFEPWSRETGLDRAADNHYPTSVTEVIAARPVQDIAAKDCVLFLWATVPMLSHALAVIAAWSFEYRTNFAWVKDRIGTGYWNRNRHEHLLVGVKGNVPAPAPGAQWESMIEAPIGRHSEKPAVVYELIESYFPNLPKIELNARCARQGWDRWGADAPAHEPACDAEEVVA